MRGRVGIFKQFTGKILNVSLRPMTQILSKLMLSRHLLLNTFVKGHAYMAGDIHFIERMGHMICIDKSTALWESGWWAISSDTASKLVGGRIYFHKAQDKPSFFGGRITEFRVETKGSWPGRVLFKFITGQEYKGVRAGRDGWSMEKKVVFAPVD